MRFAIVYDERHMDHLVTLDQDHPGFRDPEYRTRRNAIAASASRFLGIGDVPNVEYTHAEDKLWTQICSTITPLHDAFACDRFLQTRNVARSFSIDVRAVPQFSEINRHLQTTGFSLHPVAGLVTARHFLEQLAHGVFLATQYIRHTSAPFYTPEPDIVHEVIGHAILLCDPEIAEFHREIGRAAVLADDVQLERLIRLYWYGIEFGLVRENGTPKAFGAGLLSSIGEIQRVTQDANICPFETSQVANTSFDPTAYQPTLFVADSINALLDSIRAAFPA